MKPRRPSAAERLYQVARERWAEAITLSVYDDPRVMHATAAILREALEEDPEHVPSLALLGDLLMEFEDDEARQVLTTLQRLQPEVGLPREKLAMLEKEPGPARTDEIRDFLEGMWLDSKEWSFPLPPASGERLKSVVPDGQGRMQPGLDAQVAADASEAVELTKVYFSMDLDFSVPSVQRLEEAAGDVEYSMPGGRTPDTIDQLVRLWGSYLGEVFRQQVGATWVIWEDQYGRIPAVQKNGQTTFPHTKVRKRLEQGDEHNLWGYFQALRALMAPGADHPSR